MKRRFLAMLLSVAMVLTMLPVTAFASDGTGAGGGAPQAYAMNETLTVRAIKSTGTDNKITLKVTVTSNSAAVTEFYYRTSATSDNLAAPDTGTALDTTGNTPWKQYKEPFDVTSAPDNIEVVEVATTGSELKPTSYGKTSNIYNALSDLTITIGGTEEGVDPNAITVKNGDTTVEDATFYVLDDAAAKKAFDEARVDWASDTQTNGLSELGTAINPPVTKITEEQNGKYLVAVQEENNAFSAVGVTSVPVKFTRPFKLYAGEVTNEEGATDLIADATYENSQYAVTVPAGTEKVTVGTGASITNPTGDTVSGNVVTLSTTAATSITVSVSDSTYTVVVSPVEPVVKNGNEQLPLTRNGSTYTLTNDDPVAYTVETLTVSGEEGHPIASVKSGVATSNGSSVNVDLTVGLNTLEVTFADGGKCTIKVTRNDADPAVALYEGAKASGTDLLAGLEANNGVYTVGVPSTVTQVTVGAKAGTIATVKYTPTDGQETTATSNTITLNEGSTPIKVTFNNNPATEFTINVTKAAAFVPLNVTEGEGDKAGKVVVARAEGEGEVPTGLSVVTLAKEPTWTAATTEAQVTTDRGNIEPDDYNADTTTVPAASEADQYVVVYKTDNGLVVAFGVLKVDREERSITVNATNDDPGLLNFDSTIHEYTISIPATVAKATVAAGPGAAKFTCTTAFTKNTTNVEVTADPGNVSTVTVTFTGVENGEYKIKLVWAKASINISDADLIVTATPDEGNVNLVEDDILQAISSTTTRNDAKGFDDPVEITATTSGGTADATTVTLPASAAELLQDTGIDAKVVTDAGEVTIPSEAIAQTQPGTEDNPAAPVAIAIVVAKKEVASSTPGTDTVVEAAKFEVTVKKANAEGVMEATDITDLQKLITLVFKVAKDDIGEMKNPRLAYVKPAATVGGKPTYEKLPEAPEPTFDEATQIYTFTGKTSHLSEFAVVAEEATTATTPTITKITVSGAEDFTFKADESSFDVTALPESKTVSVVITTDTGKYDGITVNGSSYGTNETEGVKVNLATDGTATIEIKVNDTLKYTLNVTKDETPVTEEISIALTDKDGNDIDFGFDPDETTPYTVETDATPVTVTVTGATVTVDGEDAESTVEVEPTETGVVVVVTSTADPSKKYTITLKAKAEPPVTSDEPKVSIGGTDQKVTFKANEKGEMVAEQPLSLESTVDTVTLTVAEGSTIMLDNDTENVTIAATAGTYPVKVETAGEHKITVTDSEGTTYIINLTKEAAAVDETKVPTISNGDDETPIEFDQTNEDGSKENKTPITVANSASSYKLNVAAGAKVVVNGKTITDSAPGGEITIPLDGSDSFKIEIENTDHSKFIVNVERQPAPGSLKVTQNGTYSIYANVEISNVKAGKYYLVIVTVPATKATQRSESRVILEGSAYKSGTAKITPATGSDVLVEEYNSLDDLVSFDKSLITAQTKCSTTED